MDIQQYRESISRLQSPRWSKRQKRLNALSRILGQRQYEHISVPFSQEREGGTNSGQRILLDARRPAVQDPLARELVQQQCGLLFGEEHRPMVLARDDEPTTEWIAAFIKDTNFWIVLMDALWKGSVGSSVVVLRVLGEEREETAETGEPKRVPNGPGRYYFEVWKGEECSPVFDKIRPYELERIDRRFFNNEDAMRAQGYDVEALKRYWDQKLASWRRNAKSNSVLQVDDWVIRILLDEFEERWFIPVPKYVYERADWADSKFEIDAVRSFRHDLGEVPAFWIRPLPINADEFYPDGACLFWPVIDYQFRIDRTVSQTGRALDYAGDPQFVRERASGNGGGGSSFGQPLALGGTASDIIELGPGGKAEFIEITGEGLKIAIESYVQKLEDLARKAGAMSRVTPSSKTGATPDMSAAAMKMLNVDQLTVAGILRHTCGEIPGAAIIKLAARLFGELDIDLPSLKKGTVPKPDAALEWQWPDYYEPHGQEKLFEVQAGTTAQQGGAISKETLVANIGPMYDVTNNEDEMKNIAANQDEEQAKQLAVQQGMAQINAKYGPAKGQANGVTPK